MQHGQKIQKPIPCHNECARKKNGELYLSTKENSIGEDEITYEGKVVPTNNASAMPERINSFVRVAESSESFLKGLFIRKSINFTKSGAIKIIESAPINIKRL